MNQRLTVRSSRPHIECLLAEIGARWVAGGPPPGAVVERAAEEAPIILGWAAGTEGDVEARYDPPSQSREL